MLSEVSSYLNEIGRHPVLTKEAQLRHCKRIHAWVNWPEGRDNAPARISRAGRRSMDVMIRTNLRLVVSIARKYMGRGLDLNDLIQEGNLGLVRGLELYDPARGYAVTTYAYWWIRQSITRAIFTHSRTIRLPVNLQETAARIHKAVSLHLAAHHTMPTVEQIAAAISSTPERVQDVLNATGSMTCCSLDKLAKDEGSPIVDLVADPDEAGSNTPEGVLLASIEKEELDFALAALTEQEELVIKSIYLEQQTIKSLSRETGLSSNKIQQIKKRGLLKMRLKLSTGKL